MLPLHRGFPTFTVFRIILVYSSFTTSLKQKTKTEKAPFFSLFFFSFLKECQCTLYSTDTRDTDSTDTRDNIIPNTYFFSTYRNPHSYVSIFPARAKAGISILFLHNSGRFSSPQRHRRETYGLLAFLTTQVQTCLGHAFISQTGKFFKRQHIYLMAKSGIMPDSLRSVCHRIIPNASVCPLI